jgi:hypothetical protein
VAASKRTKEMPFHEVAGLFPLLEGEEFEALKADIAAHGLREPVWTWRGKILDGRNRYRACRELGVEPALREWDGQGSLVAFVLSLNLHRRHLGSCQRAAVAADVLPLLEREARERQRQAGKEHGRGRPRGKLPEQIPGADGAPVAGEARQQAARLTGTNARYVSMAKRVRDADPELFQRVKRGELNLYEAKNELHQREKRDRLERAEEERLGKRCGQWGVEIRQSESSRNLAALEREV